MAVISGSEALGAVLSCIFNGRHRRRVFLWTFLDHSFAADCIDNGFRNIGSMVADALKILCTEQEMRTEGDVARILHHVREKLAEERRVHGVYLLVARPDLSRGPGVTRRVRIQYAFELAQT